MKSKTFGEIARENGFSSLSEMVSSGLKAVKEVENNSFNIGQKIKLQENYKPTHFKDEEILPKNTPFKITDKSGFTLGRYSVKLEGYDVWFQAEVFELA